MPVLCDHILSFLPLDPVVAPFVFRRVDERQAVDREETEKNLQRVRNALLIAQETDCMKQPCKDSLNAHHHSVARLEAGGPSEASTGLVLEDRQVSSSSPADYAISPALSYASSTAASSLRPPATGPSETESFHDDKGI